MEQCKCGLVKNKRVDNAVIMAAGTASRFLPLSIEKPKGLLTVRGEVLIERQIRQLKSAGIDDITVVVGYKSELFSYLKDKFNVKLIHNPCFSTKNNIESLYLARNELKNTYICSSDNYFSENVFESVVDGSYYSGVYVKEKTNEWYMISDENGNIKGVEKFGENGIIMLGHVFFDEELSRAFKELIVKHHEIGDYDNNLWEDLFVDNIAYLPPMHIREYKKDLIHEFDSLDELREFDSIYMEHSGSEIMRNICNSLECSEAEIGGFKLLHFDTSEANEAEFEFEALGKGYIYKYNKFGVDEVKRVHGVRPHELCVIMKI